MKTFLLFFIFLLSIQAYAQQEKSFEEQVNYIFEKLNTEDVETGFLIDKGNPFFNFHDMSTISRQKLGDNTTRVYTILMRLGQV